MSLLDERIKIIQNLLEKHQQEYQLYFNKMFYFK
ncbi:Hypothetical Protein SLY_0549 [Strawberry lethal yellows phytoplasma (CPA) str. NZSb11]|uniref:Uncharacterized protein n=1 Tax=Strawberry lethal yellows phytoplasma (CPA) str. NZSb11 TaxID=980422 RepID=R4S147_PHYAS|nr:Hypothetical Protein SLY_0549 [Strawberry lethal yellows phytoplasma (CPA) str. NZSb11]